MEEQSVIIDFGAAGQLKIPRRNTLQMKVILLTMLNNNLINTRDISEALGFSTVRALKLTPTQGASQLKNSVIAYGAEMSRERYI